MSAPERLAAVPGRRVYWALLALVVGVFGIQLFGAYVGEEGVYTVTSLEMWHRGDWIRPTQYGALYDRPPMINWLIIPLANLIGWDHVLVASRVVAVSATLATAGLLWLLAGDLNRDPGFAWFALLAYLSGDVLFVRGWLAYSDPLFSLFIFAAIVGLHFGVERRNLALVGVALISLSCAFLTKAITAYVFYGTALLVLFLRGGHRSFLLRPAVVFLHLLALVFPFYWSVSLSEGAHGPQMVNAIFEKFDSFAVWSYLGRIIAYPVETWALFLPTSLIALVVWVRRRAVPPLLVNGDSVTWFWILGLSVLPYWLAPEGGARYLMPVFPLFALLFAAVIWSSGPDAVRTALRWLAGVIALSYLWAIWVMPYYQMNLRGGDYAAVADRIGVIVGDQPLATNDVSATGLSVTAELNRRRHPLAPLAHPGPQFVSGFVINYTPDPAVGAVVERFEFARNSMYLLCRGDACPAAD